MTTEKLNVIINIQDAGVQKELDQLKSQLKKVGSQAASAKSKMTSMFAGAKKALAAVGIAVDVKQIVTELSRLTKEAMGVDAQMADLSRTMGPLKAQFMDWARNSAAGFGISEAAAIKYGNAYSSLISGFVADTAASTTYTKELLEASAVIASRTGRTIDDVNDAFAPVFRAARPPRRSWGFTSRQRCWRPPPPFNGWPRDAAGISSLPRSSSRSGCSPFWSSQPKNSEPSWPAAAPHLCCSSMPRWRISVWRWAELLRPWRRR